jgi:hypothetical protein
MDLPVPEQYDFDTEKWPTWKARFLRFRAAADFSSKPEPCQVSMLICSMGPRAEDILNSFNLSEKQSKKFDVVLDKFDKHFNVGRTIIFERARFNIRKQNAGENASDFILAVFKRAETCNYGSLHDELVRGWLVVSIANAQLSKRLQKDSELTLKKAIDKIRQSEMVREQQESLRATGMESIDVHAIKVRARQPVKPTEGDKKVSSKFCARIHTYGLQYCPAKDKACNICSKTGSFAKCCPKKGCRINLFKILRLPRREPTTHLMKMPSFLTH